MTVYRFQNFDLAIRKRFSVNKRLKKTEVAANKDNPEIITKKLTKPSCRVRYSLLSDKNMFLCTDVGLLHCNLHFEVDKIITKKL